MKPEAFVRSFIIFWDHWWIYDPLLTETSLCSVWLYRNLLWVRSLVYESWEVPWLAANWRPKKVNCIVLVQTQRLEHPSGCWCKFLTHAWWTKSQEHPTVWRQVQMDVPVQRVCICSPRAPHQIDWCLSHCWGRSSLLGPPDTARANMSQLSGHSTACSSWCIKFTMTPN